MVGEGVTVEVEEAAIEDHTEEVAVEALTITAEAVVVATLIIMNQDTLVAAQVDTIPVGIGWKTLIKKHIDL